MYLLMNFFLPNTNTVKGTRRRWIEKQMDNFTEKELILIESLISGINKLNEMED